MSDRSRIKYGYNPKKLDRGLISPGLYRTRRVVGPGGKGSIRLVKRPIGRTVVVTKWRARPTFASLEQDTKGFEEIYEDGLWTKDEVNPKSFSPVHLT